MTRPVHQAVRPKRVDVLLRVLDLAGIFLFGIEGALAAIAGHLDFFGVMVLSFCTALGGGIIRDLLIGASPPSAIRDWRYGVVAFCGGATAIMFYEFVRALPPQMLMTLDAGGLALFAIAGAAKARSYNIPPFIAVLMGTITGVGGGTIRDVFLAQVPAVLHADVYATAALFGGAIYVTGLSVKLSPTTSAILGATACFSLRVVAALNGWNLPAIGPP
jgi:uncharacterized membrane protein YeiH